ncbi:hypothetical protein NPIL_43861 [Nephila pilipes]|uniref:Uncharacterized protein n=1 Tax=Nephila pilipes TaxID=299642 RepID=A0A8X6P3F3_NEPPI|nr:hypothetical protein NPIL_43861 [Nephila pilipes]
MLKDKRNFLKKRKLEEDLLNHSSETTGSSRTLKTYPSSAANTNCPSTPQLPMQLPKEPRNQNELESTMIDYDSTSTGPVETSEEVIVKSTIVSAGSCTRLDSKMESDNVLHLHSTLNVDSITEPYSNLEKIIADLKTFEDSRSVPVSSTNSESNINYNFEDKNLDMYLNFIHEDLTKEPDSTTDYKSNINSNFEEINIDPSIKFLHDNLFNEFIWNEFLNFLINKYHIFNCNWRNNKFS